MKSENHHGARRTSITASSCARCGGILTLNGDCLQCLLGVGLEGDDLSREDFADVLAEIDLGDGEWRLGNYQILEEIGRGGMGVIYRARQRHSKRIVALKRVLSYHGDSRETLERFRREAEAAASLDHPNILPIYEVAEADGLPFFTMKLAMRGSLQEAAPALRSDLRETVRLLAKVAHALAYAHRQGILHRDLKPGNILLDGAGEPLVSDFGLAKWIDTKSDLTRSLAIFGTPGFIAPEQAQGPAAALTPAADIYSLGAILFDLIAGHPPFMGDHALAVIREAGEKTAPKLRSIVPTADRDLETICAKCLEREPAARYHAANDLAQDLERWLEGRPIIARPVSVPVRLWRWARRNPAITLATTAGVIGAAAAIGYQVHNQHLESDLTARALAQRSIVVLPFLDLDTGEPDVALGGTTAGFLQSRWAQLSPAKVTALSKLPARWTGAANETEIRAAGHQTASRTVLTGTRRRINDRVRYSFHLIDASANEPLEHWLVEAAAAEPLGGNRVISALAATTYRHLEQPAFRVSVTRNDPAMENERARPFITTGQELLYRRNLPDMERAINCFEGAIENEPRSIAARCYLAFALMGRDLLRSAPALAQRGLQVAHEAAGLAPDDPTANRAVCALATSRGDYPDALEHGFRALEYGDRSERTFGEIGYILKMTGRPDLALRWLEKVRLTHQRPSECAALEGDCWAELSRDDRAREAYESAAAFQPDQPDGWIGLCRLSLLAGDYDQARAIYLREAPKYPDAPDARRIGAFVEFFGPNVSEAEQRYRVLAVDEPEGGAKGGLPGSVDYRSALACLQLRNGQVAEGRLALQACLTAETERVANHPADPGGWYRKAAIEAMLARPTEALDDLRSAVAKGWLDYRVTRADPRFAAIAADPEFDAILGGIAARVRELAANADSNFFHTSTDAQTE